MANLVTTIGTALQSGHRRYGWAAAALVGALLIVLPPAVLGIYGQRQLIVIAVYTLIVSGLNISFGYGGELALGQVAMFAAGAYVSAVLADHGHKDILLALVASVVAAGVIGVVSGVPGLRLSHWSLALTSFFVVLLVPKVLSLFKEQTGGLLGMSTTFEPTIFGRTLGFTGFFCFALGVTVVWMAIFRNLILSRFGDELRVLRESPLLASSLGLSVFRVRISAYLLGSLPAGAAGCLIAYLNGFVSPDGFRFDLAVALLAAAVVGGSDSIYGAIIGSALLVLGPLQASGAATYSVLVYGLFLLVIGVVFSGGIAGLLRLGLRRLAGSTSTPLGVSAEAAAADFSEHSIPGERLEVRGVTKSFGGVRALNDVTLSAAPGQVTALIGANGAGKTTLLNAISGFVAMDQGEVQLGQERLDGRPPYRIARSGVRRTYQTPLIPQSMTALEVVTSGRLGSAGAGKLAAILRLPSFWRARRADLDAGYGALAFAGQATIATTDARSLPLGTRRLLEVVRAMAGEPRLILLDEPAAGLDEEGLEELGRLIRRASDAGGTVILVEHNIGFVLGLADHVHVLELGRVIASGTPDHVRAHPDVIASYLGRRGAAGADTETVGS
ncbi:branched-chain amino acid ABC transporter ATP-binding protein/permease [Dactylosporangium salmoneum]|uniref:Branched-chain amino acid ABC transporter ATP-binding protein/permease n=1 Tax=Dactylosporangium salmoneum TaxID=53361 RepID=A0ABN3H8D9_9ACTN